MRRGNLTNVLTNLNFGNNLTVVVFNSTNLVNTAKNRIALCSNETLTNAKGIHASALTDKLADQILVKRVGNNDFTLRPTGIIEHFTNLFGKIRNIARVNANAAFGNSLRFEDLVKYPDGVWNTGIKHAVSINQKCAGIGVN